MERTEISQKVISIVVDQFGVGIDELSENTDFVSDLKADSLDSMEIVMEIEDVFGIRLKDEEVDSSFTIKSLIDCVERHFNGS